MPDTLTVITADALKEQLESDTPPVLINVLPQSAHEARHIPGSINVPVDDIEQVEQLVPNKDAPRKRRLHCLVQRRPTAGGARLHERRRL